MMGMRSWTVAASGCCEITVSPGWLIGSISAAEMPVCARGLLSAAVLVLIISRVDCLGRQTRHCLMLQEPDKGAQIRCVIRTRHRLLWRYSCCDTLIEFTFWLISGLLTPGQKSMVLLGLLASSLE
jgi:hypothetical protein